MIAPTGGLELSTAAPGGVVSVPLFNGPAGGIIEDEVPAALTAGTGSGVRGAVPAAIGLPLPLVISNVLILDVSGLT